MKRRPVVLLIALLCTFALVGLSVAEADTVLDCCERHLQILEATCACGLKSFSCWANGRGGCSTSVTCKPCI